MGGSLNPIVITSDEDEELFRLQQEPAERGEPSPFNRLGKILRCGVHNGDGSVKLVTFGLGFVVGCVEVALILILVKWLSRFRYTQWLYTALCIVELSWLYRDVLSSSQLARTPGCACGWRVVWWVHSFPPYRVF